MFSKVLIANRGEIALRILRACKELGLKTVIVYSEADKNSLPVLLADEKVCIGPPKASDSYLNVASIISAAEITRADAVHPGYGFLAENPRFAEICENHGIKFIGPPAEIIRLMGDKQKARQTMKNAKLPIIPGSNEVVNSLREAKKIISSIGYPVMLKAVAGGGGKGMRIVHSSSQLEEAFQIAQAEAEASFGNPSLYIEKYLEDARHIEVQVIGDSTGKVVALAERECSVQRKHQKIIEETPSPAVNEKLRKKLLKDVEQAASAIGYQSLGTFEFLMDKDGNYYFMEANTRVQVEHPITEMIYDIDLVKEQIKIAGGEKISFDKNLEKRGHSIECRINAEDPENFTPSPGKIEFSALPGGPGIRIDTAIYSGYEIPPFYDSLIAKIIVHASNREEAINKMKVALETTTIVGIKTNIPLHLNILANSSFKKGDYNIRFMENFLKK
ncbi:acetyl-CoA carboxylase biotin carboxylase subunit [Candidatus Aminicenantes bacterium AC-335-K20]|jgi:acetyl-CoA carboxylase biotin carboxylase subunit|nr:acetyl-CoA carboxylase biotin carboxylase subunit [SCandidatus Aminicenantes bacterium Aminicenantia_JdfR_composite]MCP2597213.1 acetyl-CoA carboxylase biotin carboxylase subunit [Candidatus Aminicenantes bacterium AC-335-G13]MCP2598482.1 acetyl-CoA carboxylase biotin carboxylase subunit [Candidatus Aminicenantes bacterium AC-335-L06]MCP2618693.1 acetyl-CoA carboxylase biotin carboxylase subunit [Candidatus Aminicenantes bacterium AC-335-A11]MCP2619522.1 acetyl-CoA carboxylase biotin carboxy